MKKKSLAISWQVVTAIVIGLGVFWTIGKCLNKAYDKVEKGDREEAIADYSQAIKLNPDDANAYYNRGIDRDDLKDYQGAHREADPRRVRRLHNRH